ncbi:hypothetical protein ACWELV_33565 [Streptomyces mirabilis]
MAVAIAGDTGVAHDLLQAVNRGNAEVLFPRLAASPAPTPVRPIATRLRQAAQRAAARLVFKLVQPGRLSKVPKPPPGVRGSRGRRRHRRGVDGQTDEFFLGASPALHHEHCRICADANGRAADACREMLAAVRS